MTDTEPQVEYSERYLSQLAYGMYILAELSNRYGDDTSAWDQNVTSFALVHDIKPRNALLAVTYCQELIGSDKAGALPTHLRIPVMVAADRLKKKTNQNETLKRMLEIMTLFALVFLSEENFPQIAPEDDN